VAQDIFTSLLKNEYMYTKVTKQMYSPSAGKFLPDRYIEGKLPQVRLRPRPRRPMRQLQHPLRERRELINPRSKLDNSALELRDTEHFFIDLPAIAADGLNEWIQTNKEHWRPQVINFARNFVLEQGLIGRAVTRDMEWGINVPVPGYEDKVMYVWFEAVIGYLSATIEWSKNNGDPGRLAQLVAGRERPRGLFHR
jgi:methionyl-tRNA synthetase